MPAYKTGKKGIPNQDTTEATAKNDTGHKMLGRYWEGNHQITLLLYKNKFSLCFLLVAEVFQLSWSKAAECQYFAERCTGRLPQHQVSMHCILHFSSPIRCAVTPCSPGVGLWTNGRARCPTEFFCFFFFLRKMTQISYSSYSFTLKISFS